MTWQKSTREWDCNSTTECTQGPGFDSQCFKVQKEKKFPHVSCRKRTNGILRVKTNFEALWYSNLCQCKGMLKELRLLKQTLMCT